MNQDRDSGYRRLLSEMLLEEDALLRDVPRISIGDSPKPSLGGIHILGKLGQGGMGSVYLGWHSRLETEVAVKVLPPYLAQRSSDAVQRFLREARLAARVQSPNLVGVRDVNEENGYHFIVMEYVNGLSAGKYVDQACETTGEALPEEKALEIVASANEGLVAAHSGGIVHRDIKPDNILLPRDEHGELRPSAAKLADLGLARPSGIGPKLTAEGFMVGTPGFLSPEQAQDARTAGKPSDVFGMGATLYALLTGKAPFDGDTSVNALVASITKDPKPIEEFRPDLSLPTQRLVARCMEKKPQDRFADAAVLKEALAICRNALGKSKGDQERACAVLRGLPGPAITHGPEARAQPIAQSNGRGVESEARPAGRITVLVACMAIACLLAGFIGYQMVPHGETTDHIGKKEVPVKRVLDVDKNEPPAKDDGKSTTRGAPEEPPWTPDRLALSGRSYWLPPDANGRPGNLDDAVKRAYDEKLPHPLADRLGGMPYGLEIWRDGQALPMYVKGREVLVPLVPQSSFSVQLSNQSDRAAAMVLNLDFSNSIGKVCEPPGNALKWVLKAGQSAEIRGWQMEQGVAERFVFEPGVYREDVKEARIQKGYVMAVVYRETSESAEKTITRGQDDGPNAVPSKVKQVRLDYEPVPAAVLIVHLVKPSEVEGLKPLP